jgi:drug/metabolite transporter (DMT)-like permease
VGVPIVSSTSAGRGADEVKARAALTEASLCERGRLRKSCWRIMLSMAGVMWVVSSREGEGRQRVPSSGVKFPLSADSIESDWLYVGKRGLPSILFPFFLFFSSLPSLLFITLDLFHGVGL